MALAGPRFMRFHRMILLPPIFLLTLTCLYTSSTLSPFSARNLSYSHGEHSFSDCENPPAHAFVSRSFLSIANFPASPYIKDVVMRHSVLKVKDSSGETATGLVSRHDTDEVERVTVGENQEDLVASGANSDIMRRIRDEEWKHSSPGFIKDAEESTMFKVGSVLSDPEPFGQILTGKSIVDRTHSADKKIDHSLSIVARQKVGDLDEVNVDGVSKEDVSNLENGYLASDVTIHGQLEVRSEGHASARESVPKATVNPSKLAEQDGGIRFSYDDMTEEVRLAGIDVENLMDSITESAILKPGRNTDSSAQNYVSALDSNLIEILWRAPQGSSVQNQRSCEGRRVFVYDLPSKFNYDLVGQCDTLLQWFDFCDYFSNEGMGLHVPSDELTNDRGEQVLVPDGSWFLTHQYALELIFHARLKHYPCLTTEANEASLFFIPYYAGLDVIRWHFRPNVSNDLRDALTNELITWLETQETWHRNQGRDHALVLGKIGWDFRRPNEGDNWGSKLLQLPSMLPPAKLLIERNPWHENDIGVPHPTFFHPKNDDEIRTWLIHVEQSERRYLVSFAGMPRPNMLGNVRDHLIQQCFDHPTDCFLLRCEKTLCLRPDSTMDLFLHSHFCLQPPGDSPTRRSVFDSLVGGCIPVLFDPYTAYYQYPWHLPQNASSYSVFIPSPHVMKGKADVVEILKNITREERTAMRTRIVREIIPGLLYSKPGTNHSSFRDAFDISVEALLNRVANMRAQQK